MRPVADRFFDLRRLRPDVGDKSRVAVAADGILEAGGELGLTERDVVSTPISQRQHHLLEETQRLVDVHRLLLRLPFRLHHIAPLRYAWQARAETCS